jgi:catechol 2,3-dioxygenase-like lactoylglutathione lyase family enzyme
MPGVSVELNHTMILAHDREASAAFLADLLDLEVGPSGGPFLPVATGNGVTLLFASAPPERISVGHYAFLVSEEEFDAIFARIAAAGLTYWADPRREHPMEINRNYGGRGLYFLDPAGHGMEVLTRAA